MGVDSGLPDFRGAEGFWNAYPAYRHLGLEFSELANPRWFRKDPALAWGFYGHRLNLYRAANPHAGFEILRRWSAGMKWGAFVFTSNVDGQFQKAGFSEDRIVEVHGSIHHVQCLGRCGIGVFPADAFTVSVNEASFRGEGELPACPRCGLLVRPNILMFGDYDFDGARTRSQQQRLDRWLTAQSGQLVVIELGAGRAVPTVRDFSENVIDFAGAKLIRINPRDAWVPEGGISLSTGALAALEALDVALK